MMSRLYAVRSIVHHVYPLVTRAGTSASVSTKFCSAIKISNWILWVAHWVWSLPSMAALNYTLDIRVVQERCGQVTTRVIGVTWRRHFPCFSLSISSALHLAAPTSEGSSRTRMPNCWRDGTRCVYRRYINKLYLSLSLSLCILTVSHLQLGC